MMNRWMLLILAGLLMAGLTDLQAFQGKSTKGKGKPAKAAEGEEQDDSAGEDKDDLFEQEEQDKQIQKALSAGWKEKTTSHYRIFTNSDDKTVLPFMADRMELMFKNYVTAFKPDKPITEKAPIFLHKDRGDYVAGGGPPSSGAYYHPVTRELRGYVDKETTLNYFFHEGTHQFFDIAFPGAFSGGKVPTWMSEGVADCFGASKVKGSTIIFNTLDSAVGEGRMSNAKSVIGSVHLKDLLNMSKAEYYRLGAAGYALGWSFCYFLWNWQPGRTEPGANDGKYRGVIGKLVKAFKEGKSREEAYAYAFDKLDINKMHEEWVGYVRGIR